MNRFQIVYVYRLSETLSVKKLIQNSQEKLGIILELYQFLSTQIQLNSSKFAFPNYFSEKLKQKMMQLISADTQLIAYNRYLTVTIAMI
jgi:hypothetical protein